MCGICGFTGESNPDVMAAMLSALRHRGPDDEGTAVTPECSIGIRRLAIIDVAGGHQPAFNEDGTIGVVLNGEIYNYRELRAGLARRGHQFRSNSDTEVLPHLYEEYGNGFVSLLRGMFAIAIWDDRNKSLLLARDRAGEKPLFYAQATSGLVFASELKAVLVHPKARREIDAASLGLYLSLQYVPGPTTILQGINKLPPGHLLVWSRGRCAISQYWEIAESTPAHFRSWQGAVDELKSILHESVAAQSYAEVPVGALLSGGIDSAGIVALLSRQQLDAPLRTFTVGFENQGFDERERARVVAHALGTRHTELVVEAPDFEDLTRMVWHLDEPVADQAAIPTYLIARVASQHVKVVLTGEGADELFGGYPRYRWFRRAARLDGLPKWLRTAAAVSARHAASPLGFGNKADLLLAPRTALERHLAWIGIFGDAEINDLLVPDVAEVARHQALERFASLVEGAGESGAIEKVMYLDFKTWLVDDILTKADRMSMAWSIEARAPYLDRRVVEFATSLPPDVRLRGKGKALLRAALAGMLPQEVLDRGKHAFQVPVQSWLAKGSMPMLRDALLAKDAVTRPLFRAGAVEALLQKADARSARQVWALSVLEVWMRQYLKVHASSPLPV
jgi:asparagine synthase (glutamine-hydrolysing)